MFQFCHIYQRPRALVNGFRTPARFSNPVTGRFRNPASLVNGFRMSVGFRNPATSRGIPFRWQFRLEYFNICYKQLLFRCDRVPNVYKMEPITFMKKHFVSKVSSFTIVAKSCILVEAGFRMNDYSFPKMLFLSLNFWRFHHILVTQLSVQGFQQETEFHFFKIFQSCFWDWHIHKLYYFYYKESRATDQLILFGTIPQSICLVQSEILAYLFYHWYISPQAVCQNRQNTLNKKYFEETCFLFYNN